MKYKWEQRDRVLRFHGNSHESIFGLSVESDRFSTIIDHKYTTLLMKGGYDPYCVASDQLKDKFKGMFPETRLAGWRIIGGVFLEEITVK